MIHHTRIHIVCFAAGFMLPGDPAMAAEIHVAPTGGDRYTGTISSPLATPQAARDKLRQLIAKGLTKPVNIIFTEGTYKLGQPLELRPEDSGTKEFPEAGAAPATRRSTSSPMEVLQPVEHRHRCGRRKRPHRHRRQRAPRQDHPGQLVLDRGRARGTLPTW